MHRIRHQREIGPRRRGGETTGGRRSSHPIMDPEYRIKEGSLAAAIVIITWHSRRARASRGEESRRKSRQRKSRPRSGHAALNPRQTRQTWEDRCRHCRHCCLRIRRRDDRLRDPSSHNRSFLSHRSFLSRIRPQTRHASWSTRGTAAKARNARRPGCVLLAPYSCLRPRSDVFSSLAAPPPPPLTLNCFFLRVLLLCAPSARPGAQTCERDSVLG